MKTLYHGSNTLITDGFLTPHISFDYKPFIYATSDYAYALVRCGKFNPEDFAIKEEYENRHILFTLIELRKNAFKDVFNTEGYIYTVDKKFFKGLPHNEYVSENSVPILNTIHIENVWETMNEKWWYKYRLIPYEDSEKYFKDCGIDKDAYLKRRRLRIEKMKSLKE